MTLADWLRHLLTGDAPEEPDNHRDDETERAAARREMDEIERVWQRIAVERDAIRRRPPGERHDDW